MTDSTPRIILGGVRGSTPISHPEYARYGGATTSVLVDSGTGWRIVIDGGTGLRTLEPELTSSPGDRPVLMLFTHYHLDHLIGLPSFSPLYDPEWHILLAAPERGGVNAGQAVARLMEKPFWPVRFRARQQVVVLPDTCGVTPYRHGPFDLSWCAVHHVNGCHAYRMDERESGASLVFATDLEWALSSPRERTSLIELCTTPCPADVLIMEGHYDTDSRTGWGHSRWQDAVEVAKAAGVRQLVVTHHAPEDDDLTLSLREERVRAALPKASLGRQGMAILWRKER